MGVLSAILLLAVGAACTLALHDIPDRYDVAVRLDFTQTGASTFKFFYTYDSNAKVLKMAVKVLSLGWVGIGFSRNGRMAGSDVIIGWVDNSGKSFFADRYAFAQQMPRVDKQQDWTLINATETDGYTILEMERPLETCDQEEDLSISVGDTLYLIYAYHTSDPTDENSIPMHLFWQSRIINLFGAISEPSPPADVQNFVIAPQNVAVPSAATTYWCTTHLLPEVILNETQYITSFGPMLSNGSARNVHHMLVYKCNDLTNSAAANTNGHCHSIHDEADSCRSNLLIAGWAVGGSKFVYPQDVALPIGRALGDRYVLLETHYDNPDQAGGIVDSSGVVFEYTSTPRKFNAGATGVGREVNSNLFVPPDVNNFNIYGYCSSTCTNRYFPQTGITIFANFLHTHTVGEALILRHVRRGIELPPIDMNLNYDFDFQQTNHITPRTVLPGDDLVLECRYRSSGRNVTTFGGESTNEEMCFAFMYYYPAVDLTYCLSYTPVAVYSDWIQKHAPQAASQFNGVTDIRDIQGFLDGFQWTNEALRDLESVNLQNRSVQLCNMELQITPPRITVPYQPPNACAVGEGGGGAAQLFCSTTALVLSALLAMLL